MGMAHEITKTRPMVDTRMEMALGILKQSTDIVSSQHAVSTILPTGVEGMIYVFYRMEHFCLFL